MDSEESKYKSSLYPGTTTKKTRPPLLPPISGVYKLNETSVDVEVKLDVDKIREYSPVLNTASGTIFNNSDRQFLWLNNNTAVFFRCVGKAAVNKMEGAANNDTLVKCEVEVTYSGGSKVGGMFEMLLRLPQDGDVWTGNITLSLENSQAEFDGLTWQSSFFREVGLDVDYVDKVVIPTISLKDFHDAPEYLNERTIDVFAAFEDAGVKIRYNDENRIDDPTPNNPWTKDDLYDVMMNHFDQSDRDVSIWCMIAKDPPDERYMGCSFEKNELRGFGLFTGHKSFKGIFGSPGIEHAHASRRFLFYFVHEIGHAMGLVHPFEIGKPESLSWMNYQWKYDARYGPGEFYHNFEYSFTNEELVVLRHGPEKHFANGFKQDAESTKCRKLMAFPTSLTHYDSGIEVDGLDKKNESKKLEFSIKVRTDPYGVNELVDLEARLKNKGSIATVIDGNLEPEGGNVMIYVTYPDENVKICESFLHYGDSSAMHKQIILHPASEEDGMDRYSQLIQFGEGKSGPIFNEAGKYFISAIYTGGDHRIVSNKMIVNIEGENEDRSDVNVATILGGSNLDRFTSAFEFWKRCNAEPTKQKHRIVSFIAMVGGMSRGNSRQVVKKAGPKFKTVTEKRAVMTPDDFIKATESLVKEFQNSGTKPDNIKYEQLVFKRGKMLIEKGHEEKAKAEFNQLLADLVLRGIKYSVINAASNKWQTLSAKYKAVSLVEKSSSSYLQNRLKKILAWYPKKKVAGKDFSKLGLENNFSDFNHDHINRAMKVVKLLFNKYSETNEINDVLDYADTMQKGHQINFQVLHWALEVFVVHNRPAKTAGLEYPTPPKIDKNTATFKTATFKTVRDGAPAENWMNYWRSDADYVHHHKHWHMVYVVGQFIGNELDWFGDWTDTRPELFRQGEIFAYMHQQMLARYDAERETWGLKSVTPWRYDEFDPVGFNAGSEFHNNHPNKCLSPRNPGQWSKEKVEQFQKWEAVYNRAIRVGCLPTVVIADRINRIPMNTNWAGHVIEASTQTWPIIGSIHNSGHDVFSEMSETRCSYMGSQTESVRDPMFYRWHKHVDNLWQIFAETQSTELCAFGPDIIIGANDVIMSTKPNPPIGFGGESTKDEIDWDKSFLSDEMVTYLGPPEKEFEMDYKISHAPFYYHIRFRRGLITAETLNLTVRIFICPAQVVDERKRWIEMDKFVFKLASGESSAVISRPDYHSSVTKREQTEMKDNIELRFTTVQPGFCECGWPYSMLLPRGTPGGEQWRLCVFISNNDVDGIGISNSCGSMSYCGTSGAAYPDQRVMGYPFANDITINGRITPISRAMKMLPNATVVPFIIRNEMKH